MDDEINAFTPLCSGHSQNPVAGIRAGFYIGGNEIPLLLHYPLYCRTSVLPRPSAPGMRFRTSRPRISPPLKVDLLTGNRDPQCSIAHAGYFSDVHFFSRPGRYVVQLQDSLRITTLVEIDTNGIVVRNTYIDSGPGNPDQIHPAFVQLQFLLRLAAVQYCAGLRVLSAQSAIGLDDGAGDDVQHRDRVCR